MLGFALFYLGRVLENIFDDIQELLIKGGYFTAKTLYLVDKSAGLKIFGFNELIPLMRVIGKISYVSFT